MRKKFKQFIDSLRIEESAYQSIKADISDNNRRAVWTLCPVCAVIVLFLWALGKFFYEGVDPRDMPIFVVAFAFAVAILVVLTFSKNKNFALIQTASYATMIAMLGAGVVFTYLSPDQNTVAFVVLVGLIPMVFVDRPRRIAVVVMLGTAACAVVSFLYKDPAIRALDVVNVVFLSLLSSSCGFFAMNAKIRGYLMQKNLDDISNKDLLTGLKNRNNYELRISEGVSKDVRSLCCIYIDVNGLHDLNNKKGHKAGDEMLQYVANALRLEFGEDGTYRIGGDEFVVLAQNLKYFEVSSRIENIKAAVASQNYHIALGVEYQVGAISFDNLIKSAEQKMRDDKRNFYLNNNLTYLKRRDFFVEEDMEDASSSIENKIRLFRYMLDIMSKNTNDFLFVHDIKRDINWFYGDIDKSYAVREQGSISNTTEQLLSIVHPADRQALSEDLLRIAKGEQDTHNMNYRWVTRDGEVVWISCRGTVEKDENGEPVLMFGRVSEASLRHLYNPQNGFWNRQKLLEDLADPLYWDKDKALMMLTVDRLADINLAHGNKHGDSIMKSLGGVLEDHPLTNEVYNITYNTFAAVVSVKTQREAYNLFADFKKQINGRYDIFAAAAPIDHKLLMDERELIDSVKVLLQKAEADFSTRFAAFDEKERSENAKRMALYEELKRSVNNGFEGFYLNYQPKINGKSFEISGAEVLLRYTSASIGTVYPDTFIPILESSGLIKQTGIWVLEQALERCNRWRRFVPDFEISVNFSVVQFSDLGIVEEVERMLREANMPGCALTIEITESKELLGGTDFERHIAGLKANGVKVAIDDFGTGYSNFNYLKELDIDEIKIDRLFIKDIEKEDYNYSLLVNIISFARSNGISVCCEGVETEEELAVLRKLEPEVFQGYLFCKPGEANKIEAEYIRNNSKEFAGTRERLRALENASRPDDRSL